MDKKKLIVIAVTNDLNYDQRMQRHAQVLVDAGFEVLWIGRERNYSLPLTKKAYQQKRLKCLFNTGKLFYLEFNIRLFFVMLRLPADIYLAVDLDTLLSGTLAAVLKRKKLVFDAHEYFTEVPELQGRNISKGIWQILANRCIPLVDAAYTVGPALASLFSKQYKKEFQYILNVPKFISNREKKIWKEGEKRIILYQGALNEGRGLESLISVMKSLDAVLWIAGEGDLSIALRERVREEGLNEKVRFLGFVSPEDLPEITRQVYLGCNILEPKGLSYQYSLANKFFDYLHAGIPQVCADFLEYRQINEKYEVAVLSSCKEEELHAHLNKLLNQNDLYQHLQNNCIKASQVYNLQTESDKLLQIFQSL